MLANQAFLDLTEYAAGEVVGRNCRFLQGEGTSRDAVAEVRDAVTAGREVEVELLNYRKDGALLWNTLHLSSIHDDHGELIYVFGSPRDTSALRRLEQLEQVEHRLLMEVDHRTLNALSVVTAIVRLTRADNPARYAAAVQHRVEALVRAHALLARHGWRAAPLGHLIRVEVEPYGAHRVTRPAPISRSPRNLALVLHELISNAAAHGALSTTDGGVAVAWEAAERQVKLHWAEHGGPPPPPERRPGFGSLIMNATLDRQLNGVFHRSWPPAGLQGQAKLRPRAASGGAWRAVPVACGGPAHGLSRRGARDCGGGLSGAPSGQPGPRSWSAVA